MIVKDTYRGIAGTQNHRSLLLVPEITLQYLQYFILLPEMVHLRDVLTEAQITRCQTLLMLPKEKHRNTFLTNASDEPKSIMMIATNSYYFGLLHVTCFRFPLICYDYCEPHLLEHIYSFPDLE